ncbi:PAS domain S-box-containing protein [Catalinimonas alkaloidigena]|uniref:PAS domain S-box protein n=1 Tax=Catalinimonas alkaloidigena TaxID=1075417 RepID=UPI002404CFB8|nr:PAS domain S-box protein [Catalinimonas alkaloidigena]MDF9795075.1 PAS domain S-box-containing protein [Catalinimonas alkaloidigena]
MQDQSTVADFMPHGHCYFWEPYILWSHALSDGIIALAYMIIPFSLFYIFYRRKDFVYSWMGILFAIFIFGCGLTHVFDVVNIWYPIYHIDSVVRIVTALASIGTAYVLIKYIPKIVLLPTGRQWAEVNEELSATNEELSASNEELHAANEELQAANEELTLLNEQLSAAKDEIQRLSYERIQYNQQKYKDLAESISDIFFALDTSFCFTHWNKASEAFSNIPAEEAVGKSMYELYPHLQGSPIDQFYKKVMQTGQSDKYIQQFGTEYENRTYEVNAYPTTDGISVITVDITPLQQAQKQLEEQKKQLELALWAADLGTWERDLVNDTLLCDDRYLSITGLNRENHETRLRDFTKRIHPDDLPSVLEKLRLHEEGNTSSYQEQYRITEASGQYKWVMSSAKIIKRNAEGKALRIVGVLQDITEMKKAEESNRFFKYLIDHTDDPIYWIDPHNNFRFVYVNEAACRHYGLPEEKLLGMSLPEWDPTFTTERCHLHWENIKREKSLNFESIHRNGEGEEIPVEISTNYLKYGDREFFGGHFRNISERKAHENKILELQQRLEGIIDSAMDAIITTNEEQQILIFNKSAEKMFGYTAQQVIGKPLSVLIPARFQNFYHSYTMNSENSNRIMEDDQAVFGMNNMGKEFPIEASVSQVEVGTQKYLTIIMRDITLRLQREQQEKALNKELIQQNEQLQQFGYITSHNLRSPVATLLGLLEVVDENEINNPICVQAIHRIRMTAEKMDEIIQDLNQILEYQKSLSAQREWVNFEDVLDNVKVLIASSIKATDAQISASFEVSRIYTVKSYLQSIFHNLLSNAIKYKASDRVPEIKIHTKRTNSHIIIEVSDNGLGIDLLKNKGKVFGLYKRFHHHVQGKGLGLHLVKTQTEALNGKVKVGSQLGKGTTFTLTLPISEDKEG